VPYRDPSPPRLEDRLVAFRKRKKREARFQIWNGLANAFAGMAVISVGLVILLLEPACPFCERRVVPEVLLIPAPWIVLGLPAALLARARLPPWRKAPRFALVAISLVLVLCLGLLRLR
jgi:hypothetical protein